MNSAAAIDDLRKEIVKALNSLNESDTLQSIAAELQNLAERSQNTEYWRTFNAVLPGLIAHHHMTHGFAIKEAHEIATAVHGKITE